MHTVKLWSFLGRFLFAFVLFLLLLNFSSSLCVGEVDNMVVIVIGSGFIDDVPL